MSIKKDSNIHTSVLLHELVDSISIFENRRNIVVDCTLGLAWHATEIITRLNPGDIFIGFDADKRNLELAKQKLKHIQTQTQSSLEEQSSNWQSVQIVLIHSNFVSLKEKLLEHNISSITGIYYDLGVSSAHFDDQERGFSFREDGPLDMRFDTRQKTTAADILNFYEEKDIFKILKEYGEEPYSRKIAARAIERRKKEKFKTTFDLKNFLEQEINSHVKTKMRVFQALRIEVNKELENLWNSLTQAIDILEHWGRISAISFHSLEDRIVKQTFKQETRDCICSEIMCQCRHTKRLKILTKKPILPSEQEIQENSRSRSAKLRIAEKI